MMIAEILIKLREQVNPCYIHSKKMGGSEINYIPWHIYCDLLDSRCGIGKWSWEITQLTEVGTRLVLIGKLTIYGDDGNLSMEATGTENNTVDSYGDPASNSEAMALRRCCAKFGLARSLWRKPDSKQIESKGQISRDEWLKRKQVAI